MCQSTIFYAVSMLKNNSMKDSFLATSTAKGSDNEDRNQML